MVMSPGGANTRILLAASQEPVEAYLRFWTPGGGQLGEMRVSESLRRVERRGKKNARFQPNFVSFVPIFRRSGGKLHYRVAGGG